MRPPVNTMLKSLSLLTISLIAACQTTAASEAVPAVLSSTDKSSMDPLKATLSEALNLKRINFGATDWTSSTILVLPERGQKPSGAPFHQQDFAIPKPFDLMMDNTGCYLTEREGQAKIPLKNIACKAL